jgi:hypothetical protein
MLVCFKVWFKNRRAKYRKMERNGELSNETASGSNPTSPENHSFLQLQTNHPSFTAFRNLHSVYPQHLGLPFYYPVLPMSSGSTPDFNNHVQPVSCPSGVSCNGHLCNDCTAARQPYCTGSAGTYYPQISFGDGSRI